MELKALTFDIIGTVFDAYDSLAGGVAPLNAKYGVSVNGAAFAEGSLSGYAEGVGKVRSGKVWTSPDVILQNATRANLPLQQLGAKAAEAVEDYFSLWRKLGPWPDVSMGLQSLHARFRLAILSNMSVATQSALRTEANLPFDVLLSGETVKAYKPDPAVYQLAIASLGLDPAEILMVAAHNFDLAGAKGLGFRTAFVARPHEEGPDGSPGNHADPTFDFQCRELRRSCAATRRRPRGRAPRLPANRPSTDSLRTGRRTLEDSRRRRIPFGFRRLAVERRARRRGPCALWD